MAACAPSIHVFLGRPLFLLSIGIHSIINNNNNNNNNRLIKQNRNRGWMESRDRMKNELEDCRPTGQVRKGCLLRKEWTLRKGTQEVSPTYVQELVVGVLRQDQNTVPSHDTDMRPCREQDNCLNRTQKTVAVRSFSSFFLLISLLFSVSIFIIFHFHFRILNSPSMFRQNSCFEICVFFYETSVTLSLA